MIPLSYLNKIEIEPIGFVKRASSEERVNDRSLVSQIVLKKALSNALNGIEEWSHVYVIFWLHNVQPDEKLAHAKNRLTSHSVGVFATRAPIRPNPFGLTLVELVKHEENVLWTRGLDAFDGTPVLDIKPYPDWEQGQLIVVKDFRIPKWLEKLLNTKIHRKSKTESLRSI